MATVTITPKTHKAFYREEKERVGCNDYFVPIFISSGMSEDIEDACIEAYKTAKPEEIVDGIDEAKYNAWVISKEGAAITDRVYANILFVTEDGAPISDEDFYLRERGQLMAAIRFTRRPSPSSTDVPPTTTANGADSPDTASSPDPSQS